MSGRNGNAAEPSVFAELEAMQAMLNQISLRFARMARAATTQAAPIGSQRDILALQEAHRQLKLRRERDRRLRRDVFGEPAWDMLLDLFVAHFENRSTPVTSLCIASNVPATTALRYIRDLELHGEIESANDPKDGRRRTLRLSDRAFEAMCDTLASLPEQFMIAGGRS